MTPRHRLAPSVIAPLLLALLLLMTAACAAPQDAADGRLGIVVSIVPQQYFVERVGGDHVRVSVLVQPGASPATYEPKPAQLKALSDAAAYMSIGVAFETVWLDRIAAANPSMRMIDTAAGIERIPMVAHDPDEPPSASGEGALDPHIWLSPELVKAQATNIQIALAQLDPEHQAEYKANLDAFIADIDQLEQEIRATLSSLDSNKFMVFHPSWGYFARDFGLEQIAIEIGGQEPSAQELGALIEQARQEDIHVILAQPEFSTHDAQTIAAEIGGEVLLVSPLAYDWLDNMRQVAGTFADVLSR